MSNQSIFIILRELWWYDAPHGLRLIVLVIMDYTQFHIEFPRKILGKDESVKREKKYEKT